MVVKLTQTLVGVVGGGSSPRPVVVKRLADVTVVALRVVFTVTHQPPSAVLHTLTGVAVTLTPVRKHTHINMKQVFILRQEVIIGSSCE